MVWLCVSAIDMGNLHICDGTVNAERDIQVLKQHMVQSKQRIFQGLSLFISARHILYNSVAL